MESRLIKELPVLVIDLVGGSLGFLMSVGWWKASGRALDRDTTIFIAKVFTGIVAFGMALAFLL